MKVHRSARKHGVLPEDAVQAADVVEGWVHGLDGIWVWSNYWHQLLSWRAGAWQWLDFPAEDPLRALEWEPCVLRLPTGIFTVPAP